MAASSTITTMAVHNRPLTGLRLYGGGAPVGDVGRDGANAWRISTAVWKRWFGWFAMALRIAALAAGDTEDRMVRGGGRLAGSLAISGASGGKAPVSST